MHKSKILKCAVYLRVSTHKEEQKSSLHYQKEMFIEYVNNNNWTIYNFYVDIDSGTKSKRPALIKLIEDAQAKKFDVMVAKELSRFARNIELAHKIKRVAQENNIHIVTLDNAINTLEDNISTFGIFAWLYENESQATSRRIKYSKKKRAMNGHFVGSYAPYGYNCVNGKLVVRNDITPIIVKRIFQEYIKGNGFDSIARKLFYEDIASPSQIAKKSNSSNRWSGSSIRCILRNQHYTGSLVQSKTETINVTNTKRRITTHENLIIIENTHEPIISKEEFNLVQDLMSSRKRARPKQSIHLFTSVLHCADCGKRLIFKQNRRGYICSRYNKLGRKACPPHLIIEENLNKMIINDLKKFVNILSNKKNINFMSNELNKYKLDVENKLINLKKVETSIKEQKLNMMPLLLDNTISKEDYRLFISSKDKELLDVSSNILKLQESLKENFDTNILSELKFLEKNITNLTQFTPELVNRLLKRIDVFEDGNINITYRFSSSFLTKLKEKNESLHLDSH